MLFKLFIVMFLLFYRNFLLESSRIGTGCSGWKGKITCIKPQTPLSVSVTKPYDLLSTSLSSAS